MNGQAASFPGAVHAAAQGVTVVVLTVGVDDARIRRSVAIQGLPPKGTPSPDGPWVDSVLTTSQCAGHTVAYGFAADRPGTITYHVRCGFHPAATASLVGVKGVEAGGRARTDAGHGLVNVPRRDDKLGRPAAGGLARTDAGSRHGLVNSRAGRSAGIAVPLRLRPAGGSRGVACVEAQLMAGCRVIYFDDKEYARDPAFQRLLRWFAAALAGICGRRDPDVRCRGDGPLNVRFGGRANPHVLRAPYFTPP